MHVCFSLCRLQPVRFLATLALLVLVGAGCGDTRTSSSKAVRGHVVAQAHPEVAFVLDEGGIATAHMDGSNAHIVRFGKRLQVLSDLVWSPSGRRFAFVAGSSRRADLFVYDLRSRALRRLGPAAPASPVEWSPSGAALAVVRAGADGWRLGRVSLASGKFETLINGLATAGLQALWSPDESTLAVGWSGDLCDDSITHHHPPWITFVSVRTKTVTPVRSLVANGTKYKLSAGLISWSPDSRRLLYMVAESFLGSECRGYWPPNVLLAVQPGLQPVRLGAGVQQDGMNTGAIFGSDWSPSSGEVAYSDGDGLHLVDLTHRLRSRLVAIERAGDVVWGPNRSIVVGVADVSESDQQPGVRIVDPKTGHVRAITRPTSGTFTRGVSRSHATVAVAAVVDGDFWLIRGDNVSRLADPASQLLGHTILDDAIWLP